MQAVQEAGLEVYAGMIVGFDNDDPGVFDAQYEFLREARIVQAMVGHALGDPQDAAVRPARGRGPARQRGGRPADATNVIPRG